LPIAYDEGVAQRIREVLEDRTCIAEKKMFVDIAVCDQQTGPTRKCDRLEFTHLPIEGGKVGAARIFEG